MKKILIIEDQDIEYNRMLEALQEESTARDINIELVRAASVVAAKRAVREQVFDAISIDMVLPVFADEPRMTPDAGAHLISYFRSRSKAPYLLFSGSSEEEIRRAVEGNGVTWEVQVEKKEIGLSRRVWAKALLDLLK